MKLIRRHKIAWSCSSISMVYEHGIAGMIEKRAFWRINRIAIEMSRVAQITAG